MSLRLALYADQLPPETDEIDAAILGTRPGRIGYLPSSPDRERSWFESRRAYYSRYGWETTFFGVEDEFDPGRHAELLACDAIHMTGGNTFQFLYWLRRRGLLEPLREFARSGRSMIGVSAGAILMTPSVETSSLCGDAPFPGLDDTSGLALVPFDVVPHVAPEDARVAAHAERVARATYGIPDGSGLVVDGEDVILFGAAFRAEG